MEQPQQQQQQQQNQQIGEDGVLNNNNNSNKTSNNNNYLCRQSSTRWTPTSDQIRILKDLYYNNGVRSPSAEQIQRISARLRQYGKIEGKNVFYWFQNHKARERQKKRFNTNYPITSTPNTLVNNSGVVVNGGGNWRPHDQEYNIYNKYPTIGPPGVPSSSSSCTSPGVFGAGQMGSYGYGSVTMEKSFRDCSISATGGTLGGGHNMWVDAAAAADHHNSSYHHFIDHNNRKVVMEDHHIHQVVIDHEDDHEQAQPQYSPELETLSLFPVHGGGNDNNNNNLISGGGCFKQDYAAAATWHHFPGGDTMLCSRSTSLELSLNSYTDRY